MKPSRPVEVRGRVGDLAPTGEGVLVVEHRGERRAVLVRGGAPGDDVRLAVDFSRRPSRARVLELVAAGPDRVAAECAAAARCGGCDFMHLARDAQLAHHVAQVRAALPLSARDRPIELVASDAPLGSRTRARLHARASGGRAVVGTFEAESRRAIEVEVCLALHPALDEARRAVGPLLEGAVGQGEARLALGLGGVPVLDLDWDRDLPGAFFARADRLVEDGLLRGVRVTSSGATRPAVLGDPTPWMEGPDGAPLELPAGGFAQASEAMNTKLATFAASLVPHGARVLELYAGAGNFSVLLARHALKLTTVEADAAACEAARRNLLRRELSATVVTRDATSHPIGPVDAVILDPPRAGAAENAVALARSHVKTVVYVSCDPRTLARDLATLSSSYDVTAAAAFEMFPHTSHVEAVVRLSRRRGA